MLLDQLLKALNPASGVNDNNMSPEQLQNFYGLSNNLQTQQVTKDNPFGAVLNALAGGQYQRRAAGAQQAMAQSGAEALAQGAKNELQPSQSSDQQIDQSQIPSGPNDNYVNKLIQIESGGNPNQVTGSNKGLGQFGPEEEKAYGIDDTNRTNIAKQVEAIKKEAETNSKAFRAKYNRNPNEAELYLMHQQGQAGAFAHFDNPNAPAIGNVSKFYKSPEMAEKAILGNIPGGGANKDITSKDFMDVWNKKFNAGSDQQTAQQSGGPTQVPAQFTGPRPVKGPETGHTMESLVSLLSNMGISQSVKDAVLKDIHDRATPGTVAYGNNQVQTSSAPGQSQTNAVLPGPTQLASTSVNSGGNSVTSPTAVTPTPQGGLQIGGAQGANPAVTAAQNLVPAVPILNQAGNITTANNAEVARIQEDIPKGAQAAAKLGELNTYDVISKMKQYETAVKGQYANVPQDLLRNLQGLGVPITQNAAGQVALGDLMGYMQAKMTTDGGLGQHTTTAALQAIQAKNPSFFQSLEGFKSIVDYNKQLLQRDKDVAELADKYKTNPEGYSEAKRKLLEKPIDPMFGGSPLSAWAKANEDSKANPGPKITPNEHTYNGKKYTIKPYEEQR